jgi:hypothetical protein
VGERSVPPLAPREAVRFIRGRFTLTHIASPASRWLALRERGSNRLATSASASSYRERGAPSRPAPLTPPACRPDLPDLSDLLDLLYHLYQLYLLYPVLSPTSAMPITGVGSCRSASFRATENLVPR